MPDSLRAIKYYTLAAFFVIGIITVLLGQVLPILSARLNLNDAQAGTFFLAQFAGSMTGTLLASKLAPRYGFVMTTLIGFVLMVVGLPGLNFHDYFLCWISIFVYGMGLGVTIPAVNLLTIEITPPDKQSSSVNLVNFAWGLGAILSPPFVLVVTGGATSLFAVTLILITLLLLLTSLFFSASRIPPQTAPVLTETDSDGDRIWNRRSAWLFLLFGFVVIGIESGLGGWLTTYSQASNASLNLAFAYFLFMVIGRGIASIVSRYLPENLLISICAVILLSGISLIVFGEAMTVIGAAIAGLGSSAIFPTNMVRFTKIFGPAAIKRATPLFIAGIVGAAALSWLTGVISTAYGSLRTGIVVFLFAAAAVLVLQVVIVTVFRDRVVAEGDRH
jgi:FHS family glucose/mannose:H+ symporter-like MFS transporter